MTNRAHQLGKDLLTERVFYRKVPPSAATLLLSPALLPRSPLGPGRSRKQQHLGSRVQPPFIPREDTQVPHFFVYYELGVSKIQVLHHLCCNWIWARFLHIPSQFCCLVSNPGIFSLSSSCHLIRPHYFNHSWLSRVSPSHCLTLSLHTLR